jgi:methionine aminopeptidase
MSIQNENDLVALRKIGRIVARCLQYMGSKLEPGITTLLSSICLGNNFLKNMAPDLRQNLFIIFPVRRASA